MAEYNPNQPGGATAVEEQELTVEVPAVQPAEASEAVAMPPAETVGQAPRQQGEQLKAKAQEVASRAADKAKAKSYDMAEQQKHRTADKLSSLSNALQRTSQNLHEQQDVEMADYTDRAAKNLGRYADMLRNENVNELIGRVENFARQRPGLFLGATFVAGLVLARFLKSSSSR